MTILLLLGGSGPAASFIPPYIEVIVPPDDLLVTVPAEEMEYAYWYSTSYLTDNSGNKLTDNSGNYLVTLIVTLEPVYVVIVPPDDFGVIVPEEEMEYDYWYSPSYLTDNSGNKLTDNSGNYLTILTGTLEPVYVVNVLPDDLSVTIPEES